MISKKLKQQGRNSRKLPQEILIFGENKHDSDSLKCLIEAINPSLNDRVLIRVQRDPGSLTKDANLPKIKDWMARISQTIEARAAVADIVGVIVHQDADGPDDSCAEILRSALTKNVTPPAYPVVPVQETEAWWYFFPDCLRGVKPIAWREVKMPTNINVESIFNPKEDLQRRTRVAAPKHAYSEADSLAVAQRMADAISKGIIPENRAPSWDRFLDLAKQL